MGSVRRRRGQPLIFPKEKPPDTKMEPEYSVGARFRNVLRAGLVDLKSRKAIDSIGGITLDAEYPPRRILS